MEAIHRYRISLSVWIAIIGIIYRIAPGEPTWMNPSDVISTGGRILLEHSLPPIGQQQDNASLLQHVVSIQQFPGGDGSTTLVGRLYEPVRVLEGEPLPVQVPVPVVVMAHGLGLTQDCRLQPFIDALIEEGLAVFTFDYATFGWSSGWPRHQVIPTRHIADLKAAVGHIRQSPNINTRVDTTRIALWGTSLGGGHVLSLAAMDPDIRAVVANVPHIRSGLEGILGMIQRDPWKASIGLIKVLMALVKGMIMTGFNTLTSDHETLYIPLHGQPGSAAMMQNLGDDEGYGHLVKELPWSLGWRNLASISSVIPVLLYRPLNTISQVKSPALLIAAEFDTLCPAADSEAAVRLLDTNKTRLLTVSGISHFDIYDGEPLQHVLQETRSFLRQELLVE